MTAMPEVTATPFDAQIIARMPQSTRATLWKRLEDIMDYQTRRWGTVPKQTISFDRVQMGVSGIRQASLTFKRKGRRYQLKIATRIGGDKPIVELQGNQAELLIEVPETVSNVKQAMPLRDLIDYPLFDDIELRRIDGRILHLMMPQGSEDVTEMLREAAMAPDPEPMDMEAFLRSLLLMRHSTVDATLMEFLGRLDRNKKLGIVWERIDRAMQINASQIDISDLLCLDNGATLKLRLNVLKGNKDAYGPYRIMLGMSYASPMLSYHDGSLRWFGSYRKNWSCCERGAFWRMSRRRGGQTHSNNDRYAKAIRPMLKAKEEGQKYWFGY